MRKFSLLASLVLLVMLLCPLLASAQCCSGRAARSGLPRQGLFNRSREIGVATYAATAGATNCPCVAATGSCPCAGQATFNPTGSVVLPASGFAPTFAVPPAQPVPTPMPATATAQQATASPVIYMQSMPRQGVFNGRFNSVFGSQYATGNCPGGVCPVPAGVQSFVVPASSTPTVVTFGF